MPRFVVSMQSWRVGLGFVHTLMTQVHLYFERLELVGETSAGLCAHLLVGPLLQAIEFLGDIHDCGGVRGRVARKRGTGRMTKGGMRRA
jgi:hypothetical protein